MSLGNLNSKNKSSYFLFLVVSICVLDFITEFRLSNIFILNSLEVNEYNKLWSLFTYIFSPSSFASLLLFIFAMNVVSKSIESVYKSNVIPLVYFLLILSHSVIFTLINSNSISYLSGTDGISFFIICLQIFLYKNQKIKIFSYEFNINKVTLISILSLWVFAQALNYYAFGQNVVLNSFLLAGLGTSNAAIVFLQISIIKKIRSKRESKTIRDERFFNEYEHSHTYTMIKELNLKKQQLKVKNEEAILNSIIPYHDEDRMNDILDKINRTGYASLTDSEQKFLQDYSKRI